VGARSLGLLGGVRQPGENSVRSRSRAWGGGGIRPTLLAPHLRTVELRAPDLRRAPRGRQRPAPLLGARLAQALGPYLRRPVRRPAATPDRRGHAARLGGRPGPRRRQNPRSAGPSLTRARPPGGGSKAGPSAYELAVGQRGRVRGSSASASDSPTKVRARIATDRTALG